MSLSTSTAKESFLNYFFGQNGPGPVAGANITNMPSEVHGHLNRIGGAVGRDISGPDPIANTFTQLRNGPTGDGSDAAFDMKSLGKHIKVETQRTLCWAIIIHCFHDVRSSLHWGFFHPVLSIFFHIPSKLCFKFILQYLCRRFSFAPGLDR